MTSLKINTIESDTSTTFSQVPSISAIVTAYPTVGTTIPTTTWTNNTITSRLSSYALLSSADFTLLTRGSKPVISTTTSGIIYKSGISTISGSVANITFDSNFPIVMTGAIVTTVSATSTRTCTTGAFSTSGFTIYSSAATGTVCWIAFGN